MARPLDGIAVSADCEVREVRRPPGSLSVDLFIARCDGCGQCIEICPKGGIVFDEDGYPLLVTSDHKCGRCHLCIDVCSRGALQNPSAVCEPKLDAPSVRKLVKAAMPGIAARLSRRS